MFFDIPLSFVYNILIWSRSTRRNSSQYTDSDGGARIGRPAHPAGEGEKMTEKELLRLKKSELLEIMLAQSKEIDSLRAQLAEAKAKLEDRRIRIQESGSIAEASLKLTQIFEEAQKAADLYVENVKRSAEKTQEAEQ